MPCTKGKSDDSRIRAVVTVSGSDCHPKLLTKQVQAVVYETPAPESDQQSQAHTSHVQSDRSTDRLPHHCLDQVIADVPAIAYRYGQNVHQSIVHAHDDKEKQEVGNSVASGFCSQFDDADHAQRP